MEQSPPPSSPASALPAPSPGKARWVFLLLLIAIAGGGFYYYNHQKATEAGETGLAGGTGHRKSGGGGGGNQSVPTMAAEIIAGDMDVFLSALGTVTPVATTTVRSRVDGQLMSLHFKEGQVVRAGDLLAEIDPRPFQVQLAQAEGQLAKDAALLKNARLDLQRYETLLAQDSIAKQQVDTQKALVEQYAGTVDADRGQVDSARLQLTYSRVTAPISGRIGLRQVDLGNIVHASDTNGLIVITQEQPISVVFTIPEDSLSQVLQRQRAGNALTVDVYDRQFDKKLASGRLQSIDNQIDPATGNVKLRAQFDNENQGLFPNQFVNIKMLVNTLKNVVIAPTTAISRGSQGPFVYVLDENQVVHLKTIKTGVQSGDRIVIEEGLQPGQKVIVDGLDKLRDGAKVEVANATTAAEQPAVITTNGPAGNHLRAGQNQAHRRNGTPGSTGSADKAGAAGTTPAQ